MKKVLLLTLLLGLFTVLGFSQSNKYWSVNTQTSGKLATDKAVARLSFPKEFKLFNLNIDPLRGELFSVVGDQASRHSAVISLPNADGNYEEFEVFEASNFEPALQERFPEIRAFSGKGITDKYATLKLSISPQGIQTMVFRTDKENEFIEPYSQDHTVYAVFKSQRKTGQLPWTCTTDDQRVASDLNRQIPVANKTESSTGQLKTMRLAQSVTAEYSNFFGATSASQVNLVLAAINATLTRCNGCYEKDLGVHLNLIANTTSVIYYVASTDPYSNASQGAAGAWNNQLQSTLTSVIGDANYDIGHLFGASGGGGNAGCIGCVCVNGSKGSGFTSPADGIPQGDNFDIDYVVHEVGHQMGANHTFSFQNEGSGVQKEIGSGITIMGYAGITSQDVSAHSIDIYHETSIAQIQANLATKTCPVTTNISANNATPVVAAVSNYTIPISTPFALTGSATDANAGDVLTYCWEQNDNSTTTGSNSKASPTKTTGPNWLSFSPTASPTRTCPILATILAGGLTTGPLPGGDAGITIEALSSVARTLNFRLTVRDNHPYSSAAPVAVGQTAFTDMVVTVSAASGPFAVTAPNTAVSWAGGSTQTITWSVANTTAAPVSCANVKISLSTDGGQTFPTVLIASTPNDGTQALTIPNTATTTARIKVGSVGNIFFDISNTNFTITSGGSFSTITTSAISPLTYCAGTAVSVPFTTNGAANAGNVFTAQLSNAAGSFAAPVAIGTLTSTSAGTIAATIPAGTAAGTGYRIRVVSSAPVVTGSDNNSNIVVNVLPTASVISAGGPITFCAGGSVLLSGNTTGGTWSVGGTTSSTLSATASGNYFTTTTNGCGSVQSNHITVTVNPLPTVSFSGLAGTYVVTAANATLTGSPSGGTFSGPGISGNVFSPSAAGVGGPYSITYSYTNANGCTNVSTQQTTVTATCTVPSKPGAIAGPVNTVCNSNSVQYSVALVSGITYAWSWSAPGATIASGQGTNSITVNFTGTFVSGKLSVTASNSCGTSAVRTVTVYARTTTPVISGATSVCSGQAGVPYSLAAVSGATSYIWYVPTGSHISDGTTTSTGSNLATTATHVTVNFGTNAGPVRAKAVNACAVSAVGSLTVSFACKENIASQKNMDYSIVTGKSTDAILYPNPSNGNFRIVLNNVQKISIVKIEVMNEFGQVLYQSSEPSNNGIIDLKLGDKLTNGIYLVSCTVNEKKTVKKLIISK